MIRGIIFPTQDVAGAQGWNQHLLDIGAKDFRVEWPSKTQGASMRSWRRAARNVMVFQCQNGALALTRSPRLPQPRRGAMLVLADVSSINTKRLGSIPP